MTRPRWGGVCRCVRDYTLNIGDVGVGVCCVRGVRSPVCYMPGAFDCLSTGRGSASDPPPVLPRSQAANTEANTSRSIFLTGRCLQQVEGKDSRRRARRPRRPPPLQLLTVRLGAHSLGTLWKSQGGKSTISPSRGWRRARDRKGPRCVELANHVHIVRNSGQSLRVSCIPAYPLRFRRRDRSKLVPLRVCCHSHRRRYCHSCRRLHEALTHQPWVGEHQWRCARRHAQIQDA